MSKIYKFNLDRLNLRRFVPTRLITKNRTSHSKLVGLALEHGTIEGSLVRRTNGEIEIKNSFSAPLSLDLLTDDPILVGREIRKKLDSAQVRERHCTVCLPLNWVLTLTVKLPELPEADLLSMLELEAERGFPYSPETLVLSHSCVRTANGEQYALLAAVPREHITRLESILAAAQLHPVSFSIGIVALTQITPLSLDGVLAILPTVTGLNLQVSVSGGVVALRTIDVPAETPGADGRFNPHDIMREIRITLGQLDQQLHDAVQSMHVFGANDDAIELLESVTPHIRQLGLKVQHIKQFVPEALGLSIDQQSQISPAAALAILHLAGKPPQLEFLPPRVSTWQQLATRYSSQKLAKAGLVTGGFGAVIGIAFLIQQVQIVYWQSKWDQIKTAAAELEFMQHQIKKFRPWYDESFRSLNVLRRLAEAFPEDGTVSAKTVELRPPSTVTCTGTARDNTALLRTLDKLRASSQVANVHLQQTRGGTPMQFTFNFQWVDHTAQ